MFHAPALKQPVCTDHDDDKFMACAVAGGAKIVVVGDKALLAVSGYQKLNIMLPRKFVESGLI
ncbi:MAG: putative toxin-antitoxin system toxin component, PIN family [Candidatus Sumerlaeia bacterium]